MSYYKNFCRNGKEWLAFLKQLPPGTVRDIQITPDKVPRPSERAKTTRCGYIDRDPEDDYSYSFWTYRFGIYEYCYYLGWGMDNLHTAYAGGKLPQNPLTSLRPNAKIQVSIEQPWLGCVVRKRQYNYVIMGRAATKLESLEDFELASAFCPHHVSSDHDQW